MADDVAVDRADEELQFLIEARTKRNRFLTAKAGRNSHDPEDPNEIEYQEAKADWNAFRKPMREIREYIRLTNLADDQAEPVEDNGDATASPAPIAVAADDPAATGVAVEGGPQ